MTAALNDGLTRLQRSGSLPLPPFDQLIQQTLASELETPLTQYQQLLADYPQSLPIDIQQLALNDQLMLEDGLADIRCNAQGEHLRVVIQASNMHSGNTKKYYNLVRHWPAHLFAQLRRPLETHLLGPATYLIFPAMEAETATQLLRDIMQVYWRGMHELLPLPCKTAFANLTEHKPSEAYEGSYSHGDYENAGEMAESPALQQHWPDYDSLSSDPRFMECAALIYQPLVEALQ